MQTKRKKKHEKWSVWILKQIVIIITAETSLYCERCSFINFPTDLLLAIAPHRCARQANVLLVTVNEKILFHFFFFLLRTAADRSKKTYSFLAMIFQTLISKKKNVIKTPGRKFNNTKSFRQTTKTASITCVRYFFYRWVFCVKM